MLATTERAFDALGDATRRRIFERVRRGTRSVRDIAQGMKVSRPAVSQHLQVLKDAGLVSDRRDGRWAYYRIVPDALAEVHDLTLDLQPKKGALPTLRSGACCS